MKIEFWWRQIFEILIIHKPSLGSLDVPQKIGPDRFSRFDFYWIQTDRQTDRQAKFIYRCCLAWYLLIYLYIYKVVICDCLSVCVSDYNSRTSSPTCIKVWLRNSVELRQAWVKNLKLSGRVTVFEKVLISKKRKIFFLII